MSFFEIIIKAWTDFFIDLNELLIGYVGLDLRSYVFSWFGSSISLYQYLVFFFTALSLLFVLFVLIKALFWLLRIFKGGRRL